jgi:uncharacterized membrane protein YeiH
MDTMALIQGLDLLGTLAFAVSGAVLGNRRHLDLFGVLVLACVSAVAGGIMRDLMIGAVPPAAVADWRNLAVAIVAGLAVFRFPALPERMRFPVRFFDTVGLGIFAVTGAQKALTFGLSPPMAAVMGMVTGIGGGVLRDMLTARVPVVLEADIYALAALAGAMPVALGHWAGMPILPMTAAGVGLCVFLRLMAIYRGWRLPRAE